MDEKDHELKATADRLYEDYGKPLEGSHWGEYVAIAADGQMVVGSTLIDTAIEARDVLGTGVFLFKVGERAAGRWR